MNTDLTRADLRALAMNVIVLLGVGSLGAAMAFAISLSLLQNAAMADGVWPMVDQQSGSALWAAGKSLQLWTNVSAGMGAVLLLFYGLMDYLGQEVDVSENPTLDLEEQE